MQATELNFIVKAKEGKQYRTLMNFPCGIRQHNYTNAYKQAQDYLQTLQAHGVECRLICGYLKTFIPNTTKQLSII